MSIERRKYMRFDAAIDGEFQIRDSEIRGILMTDDFSRGGFGARVNTRIPKDSIVDFEMNFPQSIVPFFAVGRVVWINNAGPDDSKYKAGIQLVEIDPLERLNIINYCYKIWSKDKKGEEKTEFELQD